MKAKTPLKEASFYRYATVLVIVIPFLLYISALRLGFVYFDDDILILINYEKISNLTNLGKAFRSDAFFANLSPYYRPLQNVSFMLESIVGGKSPFIYHLGNVLLHLLTCFSLYKLLMQLRFSKPKVFLASLIFSVHPMVGHAVLWIPARGDILVTLFGLMAFSMLINYLNERKIYQLLLHVVFLAGALFSKESGIFFPVLFILYFILIKEKLLKIKNIYVYLSWFSVLGVWYFMRSISIDPRSENQIGLHALIKNLPFVPEIVSRFFIPFGLPVTPVFSPGFTLAGILMIIGLVLFIIVRKGPKYYPMILFGAVWFLGFCLPNMFVRLSSADDNFEYLFHRTYLISIGLIIILLAAYPDQWFNLQRKPRQWIFGGVVSVLFALSFMQQSKYVDAKTFWGSALQYRPDKAWFHYYMGRYYFKQNDNLQYEKYLLEADSLKSYAEFQYQLGMVSFAEKKDFEAAYGYFSAAFKQGYSGQEGRSNFIALCLESSANYFQAGNYPMAIKRCEEAVKNDPGNADAVYNLGIYLVNNGEKARAASMWLRAIRINPELSRAYRSLSLYYRYDAKRADSANWYAREYLRHGGKENLVSPEK